MQSFWKKAIGETALSAVLTTLFCLLALALLAVFVRAYAWTDIAITIANQIVKCIGVFLFPVFFIKGERAVIKGAAAGLASVLLTMLIFGAIGGFHLTAVFLLELLLGAFFGGLGALFGKKLRKE